MILSEVPGSGARSLFGLWFLSGSVDVRLHLTWRCYLGHLTSASKHRCKPKLAFTMNVCCLFAARQLLEILVEVELNED